MNKKLFWTVSIFVLLLIVATIYILSINKLNEEKNKSLSEIEIKNIILPSVVNYCEFAENQSNEFVKNGGSEFIYPTCRQFSSETRYLLDSIKFNEKKVNPDGGLQIKVIIDSIYGRNDRVGQFQANFTISKGGVVTSKNFSGAQCVQ